MSKGWIACMSAPVLTCLVLAFLLAVIPYFVDEEIFLSSCQLAQMYKYECKEHTVTTSDGYILTIHRINKPNQKVDPNRKVALLMHCLECDSSVFLTNTAEKSLGFLLAESGIDVWIGNFRGTYYSMTHTSMTNKDPKYWDFTFQEMAWYDLPASLDYVLNQTRQAQVYYVGQSQGTLVGFIQMAEDLKLQPKIKRAYMLSPFVTLQRIRSPVAHFLSFIHNYGKFFSDGHFFPFSHKTASRLAALFCTKDRLGICLFVYHHFSGFSSPENLHPSRISVYFAHACSGTSLKNVRHYAQLHSYKTAAYFDHGLQEKNVAVYGSPEPPIPDVGKVNIPVALFAGQDDWLVSELDVQYLLDRLPNVFHFSNCSDFSHLDFIWGTHAVDCAYRTIQNDILQT